MSWCKMCPGAQGGCLHPAVCRQDGRAGEVVVLACHPLSPFSKLKTQEIYYPVPCSFLRLSQAFSWIGWGGGKLSLLGVSVIMVQERTGHCLCLQVRMVRGELVDESGDSPLEWIGLIRAARSPQEQTLEAIADLPGGQVQ